VSVSRIEIVEVGPRDGLQNERVLFSIDAKVSLIERLIAVTDLVMRDQVAFAQHVAFGIGDEAGFDQPFDFPARAVAEVGKVFDEFHVRELPVFSSRLPVGIRVTVYRRKEP